jgi:iron complex transport system substrate-binding protein
MVPALRSASRRHALPGYAILLVLALLVLTGCSQSATATRPPNPTQAPAPTTRTVVDLAGRTVTLPAHVDRVGTNYPAVNQIVYMLGGADRLVATSQGTAAQFPFFESLYPRLKDIPTPFGAATTDVNIEALVTTKPQVVFVSSNTAMVAKMESVGIPVVVLAAFNDPDQLKAGIKLVGDVLGNDAPARAQRFSQYYDANISRVASKIKDIPTASQPKVYYTAGNPLQTEGKGSIVTVWINEGGGRNIAAENGVTAPPTFATVSPETLVQWNPDFIVCRDPATKQQVLQDPRFRTIAAVRDNHVYINPQGVFVWSVRSGESALEPLWAAKTFHPDLFPDLDMRKEVQNFYQTFYSHTLTDQQLDSILTPPQS